MASKSLSEQLADITNPRPVINDPEDDIYEETRARVTERDGDLSDDRETAPSQLRRRAAALLADDHPRYAGHAVSRSSLANSDGASWSDDSAVSDDDGDDAPDVDDEDDGQLEAFKAELNGVGAGATGLSAEADVETDSEEMAEPPTGSDQAEDESDEGADGLRPTEHEGANAVQPDEDEDDSEDTAREDEEGDAEAAGGAVSLTHRSAGDEAEKGAAVKAQLGVWDQLLECRIKLQPCMQLCNQLPAADSWAQFWRAADPLTVDRLSDASAAANRLLQQLLQLQSTLLAAFPDTQRLASDGADDDSASDEQPAAGAAVAARPRKRRRAGAAAAVPADQQAAKRFAAYRPYRDASIQRWSDKTRLTAGRGAARSFAAFEQSTLKQIEQILSDRERLVRRTQLRRTDAPGLGRRPPSSDHVPAAGDDGKDYDEEIFDDNDFYHQLLRELIERKTADVTDPTALGRQWLQIQKLRSKLKKRIDTRASKGRKVRYEVYPKLVSFLAARRAAGAMPDAARDELFGSLFGGRCRPGPAAAAVPAPAPAADVRV